ncbi:MAG: hypothetical protein OXI81_01345 [Paracoccaceae bacterium]|nr:hypothetical protein [Paracoccaceae bacterium]
MKPTLKNAIVVFGILPFAAACGGGGSGGAPVSMDPPPIVDTDASKAAAMRANELATKAVNAGTASMAKMYADQIQAEIDKTLAGTVSRTAAMTAQTTANSAYSTKMAAETEAAEVAPLLGTPPTTHDNLGDATAAATEVSPANPLMVDGGELVVLEADEQINGKFTSVKVSIVDLMGMTHTRTSSRSGTAVKTTVVSYSNKGEVGDANFHDTEIGGVAVSLAETTGVYDDFDIAETGNGADVHLKGLSDSFRSVDATDGAENRITGKFYGVPGTYKCDSSTATPCGATFDGSGTLTALTGNWVFSADKLAPGQAPHKALGIIAVTNYVDFGYWMIESDGKTTAVNAFAHRPSTDIVAVGSVTGTAKFKGPATGLFARKYFDGDGKATPILSGIFTADAELMANFDDDEINGSISNFMHGGSAIDPDWKLLLNGIDDSSDEGTGTWSDNVGTFSGGTTSGGEGTIAGKWAGGFSDGNDDTAMAPMTAFGTFDGHFTNGHVLGAFGATKEE